MLDPSADKTDRTLSMMEVHPKLIQLRRERAERWKQLIYAQMGQGNAAANIAGNYGLVAGLRGYSVAGENFLSNRSGASNLPGYDQFQQR